jgi:hypothetical protein
MNRLKANIDNKNIMEWFTESFHGGTYIERMNNKTTYQVFYMDNCLCELSYRFGQNWFMFRIIEGSPDDVRRCTKTINKIIISMNGDNNEIEVCYNPILVVYEFYFVES